MLARMSFGGAFLSSIVALHAPGGSQGGSQDGAAPGARPSARLVLAPVRAGLADWAARAARAPAAFATREPVSAEPPLLELASGAARAPLSLPADPEGAPPCDAFAEEPDGSASFEGHADGGAHALPDATGAVGPEHVLTMTLEGLSIRTREGEELASLPAAAFWSPIAVEPLVDPRMLFDALSGRWLAAALDGLPGSDRVLFAISDGADPTAPWSYVALDVGAGARGDWVCMGVNDKWAVLTANVFDVPGTTFLGAKMWAIDLASALVPGGPIVVSTFDAGFVEALTGLEFGSHFPTTSLDLADPALYLVSHSLSSGGAPLLHGLRVSGTGSAPVVAPLAGSAFGPSLGAFVGTQPLSWFQLSMAQLGDTRRIHPFSVRVASAVLRGGRVWLTHSGGHPGPTSNPDPIETSVFWYAFDPQALPSPIVQSGRISGGPGAAYVVPSLAVNCAGDALVVFSRGDATRHPGAAYAMHLASDPPGTTGAVRDLRAGESSFWKSTGGALAPWGRRGAACVDPNDGSTLWGLAQYAAARLGPLDWDSRFGAWWKALGPAGRWTWKRDASGDWSAAGNWTPPAGEAGFPDQASARVLLGKAITAPTTVTLDVTPVVGTLQLDCAQPYTIAGPNPLVMSASGRAWLLVTSFEGVATHSVATRVFLLSDLTASVAGGSLLRIGEIAGARSLEKRGDGALRIEDNCTYSGDTLIAAGTIRLAVHGGLPSTTHVSGVGTLDLGGSDDPAIPGCNQALARLSGAVPVKNAGPFDATLEVRTPAGVTDTHTGRIQGSLELVKSGEGTLVVAGDNGHRGIVYVDRGTLRLGHPEGAGGRAVRVGADGNFDLAGFHPTLLEFFGPDGGRITNSAAGQSVLEALIVAQNSLYEGTIEDDIRLVKRGNAVLALANANTYRGGTSVEVGTLEVYSGAGSATGPGAVAVKNGATLAGSATVAGDVTVEAGGNLAPRGLVNGFGSLHMGGDLTLDAASVVELDLSDPRVIGPPGGNDHVFVAGTLTLDGTVRVSRGAGFRLGRYQLMTYGAVVDNGLDVQGLPDGAKGEVQVGNGAVALVVTRAPKRNKP